MRGGGKKKEKIYTPRNLAQITECYEPAAEPLGFEEEGPKGSHTPLAVPAEPLGFEEEGAQREPHMHP